MNTRICVRMIWPMQVLAVLLLLLRIKNVLSLALNDDNNNPSFKNSKCRLQLSVGRVPGSAMPSEWASSGAQLTLSNLDVEFQDEISADTERLLGTTHRVQKVVEPLHQPSFISMQGEQTVNVGKGAYCLNPVKDQPNAMAFRFFLDFPDGAVRNDVVLPAGRIFFTSMCWVTDEAQLAKAQTSRDEIETELEQIREEIERRNNINQEAGMIQKALGFRSMILLVERKQLLQKYLARLFQSMPLIEENQIIGGPNGLTFQKEGYISVKKSIDGFLDRREEYHWVGKYKIIDFLEAEM